MPASESTSESQHAQRLLVALADLVKPIVHECMSSHYTLNQLKSSHTSPVASAEHIFVNCLKAIIAETVNECLIDVRSTTTLSYAASPARIVKVADDERPGPQKPYVRITGTPLNTGFTPKNWEAVQDGKPGGQIPPRFKDVFESAVKEKIHHSVSTLPTRLLAFDAIGKSIKLVDHQEAEDLLTTIVFEDMDNHPSLIEEIVELLKDDPTGNILRDNQALGGGRIDLLISPHTRYAILSHTWIRYPGNEVTYQNWAARAENSVAYAKITSFCRVSAQHACRLGWMDTCCIDKENSSELEEAIQSMYTWYRNSDVCVVYLSQIASLDTMALDPWFTRGWTLQELVAPKDIEVYNMDWVSMWCNRDTLGKAAGITAVEMELFANPKGLEKIPISRRLQMACERYVTYEEDTAYSLMGLMGVSISIAYGEGSKSAFLRLMREVIQTKPDAVDILNHGYSPISDSAIPSTVEVYSSRTKDFDSVSWSGYVSCNIAKSIPKASFLRNSLGVYMHLLLVPGLFTDQKEQQGREVSPKGNLYGRVWDFDLLDRRLYREHDRTIVVFGVVNFSMENGQVIIGNPCLAIPLDCGTQRPGRIRSSYGIRPKYPLYHGLTPDRGPPVFTLRSWADPHGRYSEIMLAETELEFHGLQHTTLYM